MVLLTLFAFAQSTQAADRYPQLPVRLLVASDSDPGAEQAANELARQWRSLHSQPLRVEAGDALTVQMVADFPPRAGRIWLARNGATGVPYLSIRFVRGGNRVKRCCRVYLCAAASRFSTG